MNRMSYIGWAVFMVGFLGASATAMPNPPLWMVFVPCVVVSAVGAVVARQAEAAAHHESEADEGVVCSLGSPGALLSGIAEGLDAIDLDAGYDAAKAAIEHVQLDLVAPFVEGRRRYVAEVGPVVFAHFFGAFARGERNLNRTWSALVDDHLPEARTSLEQARVSVAEALRLLKSES